MRVKQEVISLTKKLIVHSERMAHNVQFRGEARYSETDFFRDQIAIIEAVNELKVLLDLPYIIKTKSGKEFEQLEFAYERKDY